MSDWITSLAESFGALGVALLMFIENVFPPIPSELVMPLAGYTATQGDGAGWMRLLLMIAAGTVGALAGAILWYWIGRRIGIDGLKNFSKKHGRWLTLTPDEIDKADAWFDRHGGKAVFVGRLIPTVRTFISVPAGASGMPLKRFLIFTTAGTAIWTAILALAGWFLGSQYEQVSTWVDPVSTAVLVGLLIWYLYRVATFRRKVPAE
ncbi:DedA family protein [Pseudooceanicola sp.]|jgi:membrane protein DedA with SNARE-associated domain|uniref:DedA family protein n=1 Tax=Pseudooceanicola sp. TaxID=1914328 RepID=UPI004059EB86